MEIIRHLNNEELTDLVIDSDQQALRQTLEALPGWGRAATERDDQFWQEQRAAIWSRISAESQPVHRLPIFAGAVAAAMILLAALMLNRAAPVPPPQVQLDPDHELLVQVERVVHSDGPTALEPAALLAEEMVQELPATNSPIRKKEPSHEN
jgi:hypothetical protein